MGLRRPQLTAAGRALVAPYTWLAQRVDDDGRADPVCAGVLDQAVGAQCLASGVDPVVDEVDTFTSGKQALGETQGQVAVALVPGMCTWALPRPI